MRDAAGERGHRAGRTGRGARACKYYPRSQIHEKATNLCNFVCANLDAPLIQISSVRYLLMEFYSARAYLLSALLQVVVGPDFSVLSVTIQDFPESVNSLSIGVAETVHQQVMMATGDGSASGGYEGIEE